MSIANAFRQIFEPIGPVSETRFDLSVEIRKKLPTENVYDPPTPEFFYRVSNAIKLCPRQEVLRHIHKVKRIDKIDAKLRKTFDFGRAFHTLVQNEWFGDWQWLHGTWECLRCEHKVLESFKPKLCPKCFKNRFEYIEPELSSIKTGVTGHLDGILKVNGKKYVVELKTTNSMQFNLIANVRRKPLDNHVKQIQMYMFLSGIKEGYILYFGKDDSETHHFEQSYNKDIVNPILEGLLLARTGMRTGTVPERTLCDVKSCARAKACPVRDVCFKG